MSKPPPALPWSTRLTISSTPASSALIGDKIHLPQSALEQLLSVASHVPAPLPDPDDPWANPPSASTRENLLPHPLIVKLTSHTTGIAVHAVPREFSAEEGTAMVSAFLKKSLGLKDGDNAEMDVEAASLPKGTKVRLRPLEAGYDDEDWKPILERYMREGFATITEGMVLEVPRGMGERAVWRFLVDQAVPGGSVCVVDTDLEVDIEPLDEDQARETLKRRLQKKTSGGEIALEQTVEGDVAAGDEHFYELSNWDHGQPLEIELDEIDLEEGDDVDLFVATDRQHHKPRLEEHIWGDMSSIFPKRIQISPGNMEIMDAKTLFVGVRGWKDPANGDNAADSEGRRYTLRITQANIIGEHIPESTSDSPPSAEHKRCPNCTQWIPSRTFFLHESFCLRNNVHCPLCNAVFKRGTEASHWHCATCSASGNSPSSHRKHTITAHTPRPCSSCSYVSTSLRDLAFHRTSTCPSKLILCRFCHLLVPQEGSDAPDAESIISGLTRHELACGGRTTECTLCSRRMRLRDMALHLQTHELHRLSRPLPTACANPLCYRSPATNPLGLCDTCFGPLYAPGYDPSGAQLQRRLERRLLRQLLAGCGNKWCRGELCRTGRGATEAMETKEALPMVKGRKPDVMPLCVDAVTARRRELAEALEAESALDERGAFALVFCSRAVEEAGGGVEAARRWLEREGVRSGER